MSEIFDIPASDTMPTRRGVFSALGVPVDSESGRRTAELFDQSINLCAKTAEPIGKQCNVSIEEFEKIYAGEGMNESPAPLEEVFPKADELTLFAVTVGFEVSNNIERLFQQNDFALAACLDAAASEMTERCAAFTQARYRQKLLDDGRLDEESSGILRFSPGYCGWHITAQRRLFETLGPGEIGISLTDSCLMQPLKSISGVIVCGPAEIFDFEDTYPFCSECRDHSCRERFKSIKSDSIKFRRIR